MFTGQTAPYNLYRTFTHEIGHWCGLLHPFDNISGGSPDVIKFGLNNLIVDNGTIAMYGGRNQNTIGDLIADTMPQQNPTFGTVSNTTPYAWIFKDNERYANFYNFMDYTDDAQLIMFTQDQMLKMVYLMARFRSGFVTIN